MNVIGADSQNYCEASSCAHSGQCTEEAEGFTCTCANGFSGPTCGMWCKTKL